MRRLDLRCIRVEGRVVKKSQRCSKCVETMTKQNAVIEPS